MMLHTESISYKPFEFPWAFDVTQQHEIDMHWHEKEVNLQQDIQQWNDGSISDEEKKFITNVLRLFTQSDVAVGSAYKQTLIPYFKNNEISNMLTSFANREGVHQRAYALIPESLGFDDSEWHAFLDLAHMKKKWELMNSRPSSSTIHDIGVTLGKVMLLEGVSLFGSFAMLLQYKQRAKMMGMCEVIEWSIRDENIHVDANGRLFQQFCAEHPSARKDIHAAVTDNCREIVRQERVFCSRAVGAGDSGDISSESILKFIRYLADRRLLQLGCESIYNVREVPEDMRWFEEVTLAPRDSNFFERRVTDYEQASLIGEIKWH